MSARAESFTPDRFWNRRNAPSTVARDARCGRANWRRVFTLLQTITLPDGRALDFVVGGAEGEPALVMHHGTPSDATLWRDWEGIASECGLRLIAMSRPGYAASTRLRGRSVASAAADVEALLDALDVPWFVTAGWSGGGPHALACAAGLRERCRAAATLAGVAPYSGDAAWLDGMGPENHAEFGAALGGEETLKTWLEQNAAGLHEITESELAEAFGGLVSRADRDALRAGMAEPMATSLRRALAAGFDGWIDDDLAFMKPWGFKLRDIAVPVTVWQGDADLMVPAAHAARLTEQMSTARAKSAPGHGHISLVAAYRSEIVRDLLERAGV